MRLRNVPGAREYLSESAYVIQHPAEAKGEWRSRFLLTEKNPVEAQKTLPLFLEIGTGKGRFLTEMALAHGDALFLGIEKFSSVLCRAAEKVEELELQNLLLLRMEAELLETVFDKGEVNRIYLNFSDPWPKERHTKRRLTSRFFLERYAKVLAENGCVEFKTDNRELFDFSLEEFRTADWEVKALTYDLHHDATLNEGNIMTEYEARFSAKGNPICKLVAGVPRKD